MGTELESGSGYELRLEAIDLGSDSESNSPTRHQSRLTMDSEFESESESESDSELESESKSGSDSVLDPETKTTMGIESAKDYEALTRSQSRVGFGRGLGVGCGDELCRG